MANKKPSPCPFCGGTNISTIDCTEEGCGDGDCLNCNHYTIAYVCDATNGGCGACGGHKRTKEEALQAWERRVLYTEV